MKTRLALLAASVCATGCTYTTFTDPSGAKFSRVSLLNSQGVGKVDVKAGDKSLTLEGYQSNQTELAAAVVASAVKAAKP